MSYSSHDLLIEKCREGYKRNILPVIKSEKQKTEYAQRMKYELEVIDKLGFNDYFLIVQDIVAYAVSEGIPVGPGRGSAAGSLVSFALGITKLDPLQYELYFERFLNKDRVSAPDIDIDFSSKGRDKIVRYIKAKYGEDRVCQVVTFAKMKARGLIRDLAKAMELDPVDIDKMSRLIDGTLANIDKAIEEEPKLKAWEEKYPELFDIARNLTGCIKNASMHAAGVIITKDTLFNSLPIMYGGKTEGTKDTITQWNKETLEELNFLKIDILGLKTMDIINDAMGLIQKKFDLEKVELNNPHVIKEFKNGNSKGIFQFETPGMIKILQKVRPEGMSGLSDVNALARPGAKQGIEIYLKGKSSGSVYYFNDKRLKSILEPTYGTITYQEQVMAICMAVAGFGATKADLIRKAIAKPKPGLLEKYEEEFVSGCVKEGQKEEWARKLFAIIKQSGNYAFNKSHSTSYALIGYWSMFLKVFYPLEFMTALLANNIDAGWEEDGVLDKYEREAKRLGIYVMGWDINNSSNNYTLNRENKVIIRGLAAITNVGKAGLHIEKMKPFKSFTDFYTRVNKRYVRMDAIKALVQAGCFDSIEPDRTNMNRFLSVSTTKAKPDMTQGSLF